MIYQIVEAEVQLIEMKIKVLSHLDIILFLSLIFIY